MTTKLFTRLNSSTDLSRDHDEAYPGLSLDRTTPANIAEGPALARDLVTKDFADSHADSGRFDELAQSDPGFFRRLFATAEQKATWEKQRLRMQMVGQSRLARLRMVSETELRVLATIAEAIVKATEVSTSRHFYDFAQAEVNAMAINSEKHRKNFISHIEEREITLPTLSPRVRARYEASIEKELDDHFTWFDTATTELLGKLKAKVLTYAGSIDG